jgi:hypothetical protein
VTQTCIARASTATVFSATSQDIRSKSDISREALYRHPNLIGAYRGGEKHIHYCVFIGGIYRKHATCFPEAAEVVDIRYLVVFSDLKAERRYPAILGCYSL